MHTTLSVFMNESQQALHADIKRLLEEIVDRDADWKHNDPEHSDCDRFNADAHLRAMLLGHSLSLQVSGGEVVLGQWQRVLVAELDGPRARIGPRADHGDRLGTCYVLRATSPRANRNPFGYGIRKRFGLP